MKYVVKAKEGTKYGYVLVITNEDGNETVKELTSKTTDGYLRLPENELGQKMIALKKLEGVTELELQKYEGRHSSESGPKEKKADLLEALALCLDKEERDTFITLCEKAKARFEVFKKKEALKKQIEAAQAALKELK